MAARAKCHWQLARLDTATSPGASITIDNARIPSSGSPKEHRPGHQVRLTPLAAPMEWLFLGVIAMPVGSTFQAVCGALLRR